MDLDQRSHFRTAHTTTNELFICFASRLSSSSSMKLTKPILSPARAASRDGAVQPSLSSSLRRRLRASSSFKGAASPFLTTSAAGKRRSGGGGVGFENPEPSSPKVTCIGQVRVKTKKKVKQTRSLSNRRSGEISFRKIEQQHSVAADNNNNGDRDKDSNKIRYSNAGGAQFQAAQQQGQQKCLPHRNQRWVHLPISICEALRDLSCLFPCKSWCFSRDKDESKRIGSDENGCGTVFARWLVSVNDDEGGRTRDIELVVGGGDEEEEEKGRVSMRSSRRHVFEDIEVRDDRIEIKGQGLVGEVEKARVSICIPPKNALLLMRCGSDPMKMASLANKFTWDGQGVCESVVEKKISDVLEECGSQKNEVGDAIVEEREVTDEETTEFMEVGEDSGAEEFVVIGSEEMDQEKGTEEEIVRDEEILIEEVESNMSSLEALLDQENTVENCEDSTIQDEEIKGSSPSTESDNVESKEISPVVVEEQALSTEEKNEDEEAESSSVEEKDPGDNEENRLKHDPETTQREEKTELMEKSEAEESFQEPKKEKERQMLPDCLLLMMCEPKLSMEVSKETWVCSTDFIRCLPERPRKADSAMAEVKAVKAAVGCGDQEIVKRRLSIDSKLSNKLPLLSRNRNEKPPRSSCSLPAASMAAVIEQKLVNAVGYEPFVLTRCKSEPMRTAAVKLLPESCLVWNNAAAKMGVGAAGVGF